MAKRLKQSTIDDGLSFIKNAIEKKVISRSEIETLSKINYPLFSFRYFNDVSVRECLDPRFLSVFLIV